MSLPYTFDFSTTSSISDDLELEESQGQIDFVSGIYVDNRSNGNTTADFVITFPGTGQTINVPPQAQGIFPVIAVQGCKFVATCAAAVFVTVQFLNCPVPTTQWGPVSVTITNVNANFNPVQITYTDRSGAIVAGGVAQQLAAVNAARKGIMIINPVSAASQGIATAESIFINFTTAAVVSPPSIEISPGGSFNPGNLVSTELISIIAATTGHKFTAKEC